MDETHDARRKALAQLYERGAHLFAFHVERDPEDPHKKRYRLPEGWQGRRHALDVVLAAEHVGMVGGSLGLSIPDVDVKDAKRLPDRTRLGQQRVQAVMAWAGETPLVMYTPTRGAHCYYRRRRPHGKRKVPVAGIPGLLEVFGDTGFVELYDPVRLLQHLDHLPVMGVELPDDVPHRRKTNGAGRGRRKGDRNLGAFVRSRTAAENDRDPRPSIESARVDAIAGGISGKEAAKATSQGVLYGGAGREAEAPPYEEPRHYAKPPQMPRAREAPGLASVRAVEPDHVTDPLTLAEAFAVWNGRDHLKVGGRWMVWQDGWHPDRDMAMVLGALARCGQASFKAPSKDAKDKGTLVPDRIRGAQPSLATGAAKLLPGFSGMAVAEDGMNPDPNLLGVAGGGVLDLRTGEVRGVRREDRITISTPYPVRHDEDAFIRRLLEAMFPSEAVRTWVLRALGSMLWAVPMLRILVFMPGVTGAGKSLLLSLVDAALGAYAVMVGAGMFDVRTRGFDLDNANAMVANARIAMLSEIRAGHVFDPVRLNQMSGGEVIVVRKIQTDMTSQQQTHNLLLAMNDLPKIDVCTVPEATTAFFDRARVCPIRHRLDATLGAYGYRTALHDPWELGNVLGLLAEGAAEFRQHGEAPIPPEMAGAARDWYETLWDEGS